MPNKKFFPALMAIVMTLSVCMLGGCVKKADDFTEEEHVRRVTERIEKRHSDTTHSGFSVYPLYNEKEELTHFLVEYEPYGFMFVKLKDEEWKGLSCVGANTSMYRISSNIYFRDNEDGIWSPYTVDETNSQPRPDSDKCWKLDENGNKICYNRSPYYVTQNMNERKYLLQSNTPLEFICAIKSDEDTFINLISSTELNVANGDLAKKQATIYIYFIANVKFDL